MNTSPTTPPKSPEPAAEMFQNVPPRRPFRWTKQRELAAAMLAEDSATDEEIAKELGIERHTIQRWRRHPEFAARVEAILAEIRAAIVAQGVANQQNRVDLYNDLADRMRRVIDGRAKAYKGIPGGADTGMLVRQVKLVKIYEESAGQGSGPELESVKRLVEVEEWAFDAALVRELREIAKQAAQDLGQWVNKNDLTAGGEGILKAYAGIDLDKV